MALTFAVISTGMAVFAQPTEPDFSADRIKAHMTFLADDLLEGREAGTRGHEIAARYIAAQFALMGLKPGTPDGSYFQAVDLLEAANTGPTATIRVSGSSGTQTLEDGGKAIIDGPVAGGAVIVDAPLVFAGYGMKDAAMSYDDYAGLDVRGKIVVVLSGSPAGIDSEIGAHLGSEQSRVAAEHGAAAIVSIPTRIADRAVPWPQRVQLTTPPLTTWVRKDGTPFDPRHGLRASVVVESAAAAALFEGAPATLTSILDEADKPGGRPKGFALQSQGRIAVTVKVRRFSSPEVIGLIEGSDPKLKQEYVALMGHADHIGVKPEGTGDQINNGALDNSAGIATLLEVARAFMTPAGQPRRSVLVVAHTAEEKGLLGADYFAHHPPVPIGSITAAIDLDMPMLLYDFTDVVAYGAGHSSLEGVFRKAGAVMGVTLSPDPMPEQAIFVRSDHYPLARVGVPAVMLATGMASGGEAAWGKFLASNYHQPSDDLSQPIRWSAGARFAEMNYRVVRELADADARPRWFTGDYFGNLFAPNAPKVRRPPGR